MTVHASLPSANIPTPALLLDTLREATGRADLELTAPPTRLVPFVEGLASGKRTKTALWSGADPSNRVHDASGDSARDRRPYQRPQDAATFDVLALVAHSWRIE